MTIYWLLFLFPALLTLAYPLNVNRWRLPAGQKIALALFVLLYTMVGALRYEVGGDWLNYLDIQENIRDSSLGEAVVFTDPVFGVLNWISAQFDLGVYLPNGVACALLGYGTIRAARLTRDPWLGILMAVPYLLIVVGMGYVRQGAAIGVILIAIATLDQARHVRTIAYLIIATGLHASAAIAFPLFGYALFSRHKVLSIVISVIGALAFVVAILPQLDALQTNYLEAEYQSEGATVRLLMSFLPAVLLLTRLKHFTASERTRSVWIGMALASLAAMAALLLTPSSTAIDRVALYFSPLQILVFGEIRNLTWASDPVALFLRVLCIGIAATVQIVWLVFATNASYWVPYQSILQFP